ncbi:SMR family transporter [Desulfovibrio legallii]|jgi:spermidine export protein MdtI|uniref:Spermidine export protein MdtI n=1 Tax=Desulfovibrio legallii TaxID=571438 RepID=A0A1G7N148_9BACT|nr:SMR family transporter [Desulfovibrio legallii]SDF67647.1 spermidine export protein MdtI [Desulfovibrio legallii]
MPATLSGFPFVLVLLAATLDVLANLLLARSEGFRRRGPGLLALALVGLAFYCLSLAVRQMDLSVAYALWGGLGLLGTALGGWLLLRQRLAPSAFAGMALLVCGMVLLRLS